MGLAPRSIGADAEMPRWLPTILGVFNIIYIVSSRFLRKLAVWFGYHQRKNLPAL